MKVNRDYYLNQLIAGMGNRLIKIVTGVRRCGKSFLLFQLFHEYLNSKGIDDDHIIEVALDDRKMIELRNPDKMLQHIDSHIKDKQTYYILLDEVQMMEDFADVLNSLLHIRNADVYVTGSNSRFLSKDVVTEFRGRGDEIHLQPLSFAEYYSATGGDKFTRWKEYYTYGGLPQILTLEGEQKKIDYLRGLCETVYIADVLERHKVKNKTEFEELGRIMASIIGSPCNPTKLSNTFKSVKGVSISHKTLGNYLEYMEDAFLIKRAIRYNVKGKKYINTLSKYYFSDMGIRNALLDFRQLEETHIMENVIYNELLGRGFRVDVGLVELKTTDAEGRTIRKQLEVDFIANRGGARYYIQSAFAIPNEEKKAQEMASFRRIDDSFQKVIIVKDDIMPYRDDNGYMIIGLMDFLLSQNSLERV
ncbi:MAG: ATP-binding protein [Bacteroidaceae bacterium]|nr:ATP-binding protein [Bacteroidaceae bacterium]